MPKIVICEKCNDAHWEDRDCPTCTKAVDWKAKHRAAWERLTALWEALDGGPIPACRDCADTDGICPNSGLPCDPQDRALEQIRRLKAM